MEDNLNNTKDSPAKFVPALGAIAPLVAGGGGTAALTSLFGGGIGGGTLGTALGSMFGKSTAGGALGTMLGNPQMMQFGVAGLGNIMTGLMGRG